jgi:hypothetical protein
MALPIVKVPIPAVDPSAFKYWPDAPPKRMQELHLIFQIQYTVPQEIPKEYEASGTVPVLSRNLYIMKARPNDVAARGRLWRELPHRYEEPLRRIIYQMNLYIYVTSALTDKKAPQYSPEYVDQDREATDILRDYLKYTDTVMDEIWDEVLKATEANEFNPDWRSKVFDEWLLKEYYVKKHSPLALIQHGAINTDIKPEDLGMY